VIKAECMWCGNRGDPTDLLETDDPRVLEGWLKSHSLQIELTINGETRTFSEHSNPPAHRRKAILKLCFPKKS